ncbi:hypothetical protein AB4249_21045 [Vibrio sp. 10N.261.55.F4]|uniref:hypothetical protein n=1 Tax=Vibrio sp. 10N.261.55.F4 TaxID=3229692 RepID=UPI00354C39E2
MSHRTEQQDHDDFCNKMQNNRRRNSGVRKRGVAHRHPVVEREEDQLVEGVPYLVWIGNEMDRVNPLWDDDSFDSYTFDSDFTSGGFDDDW